MGSSKRDFLMLSMMVHVKFRLSLSNACTLVPKDAKIRFCCMGVVESVFDADCDSACQIWTKTITNMHSGTYIIKVYAKF